MAQSCSQAVKDNCTITQNERSNGDKELITASQTSAKWKPFTETEVVTSVFRIGQSVLKTIEQILKGDEDKARDVTSWSQDDYQQVMHVIKYCKVRRELFNGTTRDCRLDDICGFGSDPNDPQNKKTAIQLVFKGHDGQMTNVLDYFHNVMGKPQIFPNGPVLKMGKACIPAELCTLVAAFQQSNSCTFSKQKQSTANTRDETALSFTVPDFQFDNCPAENAKFYLPAKITNWAIVTVNVELSRSAVEKFGFELMDAGRRHGMEFPPLQPNLQIYNIKIKKGNHNGAVETMCKMLSEIRTTFGDPASSFILCIIPDRPNDEYSQIKQSAEREGQANVLTQCIQLSNIRNGLIIKNLIMKINIKMGGINYWIPKKQCVLEQSPTLIIGINVSTLPQAKPICIVSVSGSLDSNGLHYYTVHLKGQLKNSCNNKGSIELVENLDVVVREMIDKFAKSSNTKPDRIVIYRNIGVVEDSSTQFKKILNTEMMAIRNACTSINPDYNPPITIVAVKKPSKVRFYIKDVSNGVKVEQIQQKVQYHVIWDDSNFKCSQLEDLTTFLCHYYDTGCSRSRTTRDPAPLYYCNLATIRAEKLATNNGSSNNY